jgi:hypothetical protein
MLREIQPWLVMGLTYISFIDSMLITVISSYICWLEPERRQEDVEAACYIIGETSKRSELRLAIPSLRGEGSCFVSRSQGTSSFPTSRAKIFTSKTQSDPKEAVKRRSHRHRNVESSYGLGCLSILFEAFGVLYIVMRVFVKKVGVG